MIKAIIFDFDGVIGLSEENRFKVIQNAAKKIILLSKMKKSKVK